MDDKTRELIAIGASITAHCQPCLTYHIDKARQMGIDEQEIREAATVGQKVEKGAMAAMRDFTQESLQAPAQKPQSSSAHGAGATAPDRKSCCS
jgi:AhpD family alkylhydroperoxidase